MNIIDIVSKTLYRSFLKAKAKLLNFCKQEYADGKQLASVDDLTSDPTFLSVISMHIISGLTEFNTSSKSPSSLETALSFPFGNTVVPVKHISRSNAAFHSNRNALKFPLFH